VAFIRAGAAVEAARARRVAWEEKRAARAAAASKESASSLEALHANFTEELADVADMGNELSLLLASIQGKEPAGACLSAPAESACWCESACRCAGETPFLTGWASVWAVAEQEVPVHLEAPSRSRRRSR